MFNLKIFSGLFASTSSYTTSSGVDGQSNMTASEDFSVNATASNGEFQGANSGQWGGLEGNAFDLDDLNYFQNGYDGESEPSDFDFF